MNQQKPSRFTRHSLDAGAVRQAGRGRPKLRPESVVADKGYSSNRIRNCLKSKAIKPVIPLRTDQGRDDSFDREAYRERNLVERLINRIKQWRRIATRYEKRVVNYSGMLSLAVVVLWL